MNIIDLTERYIDSFLEKGDLAAYEASFPELFGHYFEFWGHRPSFSQTLNRGEVRERRELVEKELPVIEAALRAVGLDVSDMPVVLFVGQGYTNGHSFRHAGDFYTFLALEGYETKRQVLAHVTHEIIHAVHYTNSPDFYFENKEEKERFSRMLITEGLATLLTKEIMGMSEAEALWADYISREKAAWWMERCERELKNLYAFAVERFDRSDSGSMFYSSDENDIFAYRAGYYAGMKILAEVRRRRGMTKEDLLTAPRADLEKSVLETMKELV